MSRVWQREELKAQIADTERLLALVNGHPLMPISLSAKLNQLKEELERFPEDLVEASVKLLFSGKAVIGSMGIKAKFVSETVKPFQELVRTQAALIRYGKVGKRGMAKKSVDSELYLTALPKGSFGVELSQMERSDMFAEEDVANAIAQVMNLVDAATAGDAEFEQIVEITPARNLNNLKTFLKNIDEEHSILKMESGNKYIEISEERIHSGFIRVNAATNEDQQFFEDGILRGILLESGKFEFVNDDGFKYTGFINTELPEDYVIQFINRSCTVHLRRSKTHFISGTEKTTYELLEVFHLEKKNEDDAS